MTDVGPFHVGPIELLWLVLNLTTFLFTLSAWVDARAMRKAVKALNGKALELAADTKVRAAGILTLVQALLVLAVVPQLFQTNEIRFTPTLVLLMSVSVLLLLLALSEKRDRATMLVIVAADTLQERKDDFARIERKVDESIVVAREAAEASNHTKERFDAVYDRIEAGEVKAAAETERRDQVADATASEVHDLHEGTAPEGAS